MRAKTLTARCVAAGELPKHSRATCEARGLGTFGTPEDLGLDIQLKLAADEATGPAPARA